MKFSFALCIRIVLLVLCMTASVGFYQLKLNTDIFQLLPTTPSVENLKKYNTVFASLEKLSLTIVSDKHDLDELFLATEYTIKELQKKPFFANTSYKFNLLSASEIKEFYDVQLPNLLTQKDFLSVNVESDFIAKRIEEIFEQLIEVGPTSPGIRSDPLQLSHLFWKKLQLSGLLNAKIINGSLVSKDEKAILLHIPGSTTHLSSKKAENIWNFLYRLKKNLHDNFPEMNLICIGGKRVMLDNTSAIWYDAQLTSLLATIVLAILMLLVLKNFLLFPLLFLPVIFGIFTSIGISALFAPQLSVITLGFGAVLIGISVDYVIHYIFHFEYSNAKKMEFKIFRPMSFAALSTCGALSFLVFSDFPIHVETAWVVGTGIFSSFLFVVGIFPQICNSVSTKSKKRSSFVDLPLFLEKISERKGGILRSAFVVIISIFITITATMNITKLQFIGDMEKLNYMQERTKQDEKTFFSIWGNQKGKIAVIAYAKSFEEALRTNEEVCSILGENKDVQILTSIQNLLPSLKKMKQNHSTWEKYWTQEKQEKIKNDFDTYCSEYGFSKKAFQPFFSMLRSPINPESIEILLSNKAFMQVVKNQIKQYDGKWYIQNIIQTSKAETIQNLQEKLTSKNVLIVDRKQILSEVSDSLLEWTFVAVIFIGIYILLLFFFYFVHIELVLIGLFPLLLSLLWILGGMAYLGVPLNLFSVLMIVFVFGLGVDYTTFLVTSYTDCIGRKQGFLHTTRAAIFLSALTTLIAFGVLVFAQHPALISLGVCVVLAMTTVLFNTIFLAPIVLRYFIPPNRQSHPMRMLHAINSLFCFILYVGGILTLTLLVFPIVSTLQFLFKVDGRRICLRLIEVINRNIMYLSIGSKIRYLNFPKNMKGCIVVANHTNMVDVPIFNGMPFYKVTMVKWFWKFPLVKYMLKTAGFIRAPHPKEKFHAHEWEQECKDLLDQGFNILFFPEGTRAKSLKMGRFRMGGFQLACKAKVPILPVCFYGNRWVMDKKRFVVRDCNLYASALASITPETFNYEDGARKLAKEVKKQMQEEYERLSIIEAGSKVQQGLVRDAYRYMNPVFDLYLYFKLKYDKNYVSIIKQLPREGKILDIGCGIGYLSNLLVYAAEKRQVWGIDYSNKKIDIANRSIIHYIKDSLNFIADNILNAEKYFPNNNFDAILCCDTMHYLPFEKQKQILEIMKNLLKPNGVLIIRQDIATEETNKRKKFEIWAKFCNFNYFSESKMYYPTEKMLQEWMEALNLKIEETPSKKGQKIIRASRKCITD